LEKGTDLIIAGGWFMVEHLMSFEGNEIHVKQHICNPESIISYDEMVLDDEGVVWIGLLTTTNTPEKKELETIVPEEYDLFMNLFGEPVVQELPSYRLFDH
jgi:hypothetical protein